VTATWITGQLGDEDGPGSLIQRDSLPDLGVAVRLLPFCSHDTRKELRDREILGAERMPNSRTLQPTQAHSGRRDPGVLDSVPDSIQIALR
jgi:hypothetical protein